jgi:hypothetical protein
MQIKNRYILLGLINFSLRVKFYTRLRFTVAISSSCSVLLVLQVSSNSKDGPLFVDL